MAHVELDYLLFVYALGLGFLAAMLLGLSDTVSSPLPWRWLGASAAALAVSSTADLLSLALPAATAIDVVQGVALGAGCLLLAEFARRSWAAAGGRSVGPWVVLVLASASALGLLAGSRGLEVAASYFLGVGGGVWAAVAIWRFARHGSRHRRPLMVAAVCMAGFVLVEFGVTLPASFPPATWVNRPWFLDTLRLPGPARGHGLRRALRGRPLVLLPDAAQGGAPRADRPQGPGPRGRYRRRHGLPARRRLLRDDAHRPPRRRHCQR